MRKVFLYSSLLLTSLAFISCEKDDICAEDTDTTPLIYLKFYNNDDQNQAKSRGFVYARAYNEQENLIYKDSIVRFGSEMKLPLRLDSNETTWILTLNDRDDENKPFTVSDTLKFTYSTRTEYIDKACGYRTIFLLDEEQKNPILNNNKPATWIKTYEPLTNFIENDKEEHIKIYY